MLVFLFVERSVLNMRAIELIHKYQKFLQSQKSEDRYSALLFALQIPSICSRIEFPNDGVNTLYSDGKPQDEKLYLAWIIKHAESFKPWFYTISTVKDLAERIYKLRCQLTHEGYVLQDDTKIVFISDDKSSLFVDDIVMISIPNFCREFFYLAENIFSMHNIEFTDYDGLTVSDELYGQICNDAFIKYHAFWDEYSHEEHTLNMIYDFVFRFDQNKAKEVKKYFKQHPSDYYEIKDFGRHYSIVTPDNTYFFEEYRDSIIGKISTITCRFKKKDYDKMTKISNALDAYSKTERIGIKNYINKGN